MINLKKFSESWGLFWTTARKINWILLRNWTKADTPPQNGSSLQPTHLYMGLALRPLIIQLLSNVWFSKTGPQLLLLPGSHERNQLPFAEQLHDDRRPLKRSSKFNLAHHKPDRPELQNRLGTDQGEARHQTTDHYVAAPIVIKNNFTALHKNRILLLPAP